MLLKNKIDNIKTLLKNDNVLTKLEERYCYATDACNNNLDIKIPDLVIFPETINDVQKILKYANEHKIPVIARGAGTNMVGACSCTNGGIILNFSKMDKIIEINQTNMTARVQPGVVLGKLKDEVKKYNLFFPPDPSNYRVSTIGGAIAQSSAGATAFRYGTTKDYVVSLKVVTANGELLTLGSETIKDTVGYHLNQLIVGSEGTLAIVVEAIVKLIPKPEATRTICSYYNDYNSAINAVNKLLTSNIFPSAVDFMDKNSIITVEKFLNIGLDTNAKCLLIVQIEGYNNSINLVSKDAELILSSSGSIKTTLCCDELASENIWKARRSSYAATTRLAPDVISDDIIVPRENLVEIINCCNNIADKYDLKMCLVGHIADGNLHPQFALNLDDNTQFRNYSKAKSEIYKKVLELGGTISAEHGIGLEKLPYLDKIIDKSVIDYMKLIKKAFDPNNILNPGKIFKI